MAPTSSVITPNPNPPIPPVQRQQTMQEKLWLKRWQTARQVLKDEFKDKTPGAMRHSFLCCIAVYLQDCHGIDHATSNKAADDIIRLVFEDTYY